MASLLDEIARLVDPTPAFPDPEDEARDDTSAKVIEKGEENFEHEARALQPSKLRKKVGLSLADFGAKYAGKKTSRKKLRESEGDMSEESIDSEEAEDDQQMSDNDSDSVSNDDDDDDDEKNSDDQDDRQLEQFKAKLNKSNNLSQDLSFDAGGDFSQYADDDEDEENDVSENEEDDDEDGEDEESESSLEEEKDGDEVEDVEVAEKDFQQFSKTSPGDEVAKGLASRLQLGLWDSLLEGRIKLQKAVAIINQLPHPDAWRIMEQTGDKNFTVEADKAHLAVKTLLDNLIHLQTLLLFQNAETSYIVSSNESEQMHKGSHYSKTDDEGEEEITSESDMEADMEADKEADNTSPISPLTKLKKRKLQTDELPEYLEKRHKAFAEFRDNIIQKWNDKTRLAGGKVKGNSFTAFEQSALSQIQQILSDKERLIRRTQLKRSVYQVVGQPEKLEKDKEKESEDLPSKYSLHDHDPEIFDDDDFYHQLLRELIERKTSEINDPIALSRQWLEIQKLRKKVKKNVDTKASKGRKLRYDVHKKLINFMAQYENSTWPDESRDDLFKSLFGKRFKSTVAEEQ